MKKIFIKLLTLMLVVVSAVSMVGCAKSGDPVENVANAGNNNPGKGSMQSFSVAVASIGETVVSEQYVSQTLTATVLPLTAPDRRVDWSVEWLYNAEGENAVASDYVQVIPTEDGSLIAEVRCYKAFPNSTIGVKAMTRVGGYSSTCSVNYIGIASSMEIIPQGGTEVYDEAWGVNIINLEVGATYSFDLEADNIFGNVTDEYFQIPYFTPQLLANVHGSVRYYRNIRENENTITGGPEFFEIGFRKNGDLYISGNNVSFGFYAGDSSLNYGDNGWCECLKITLEDKKLNITCVSAFDGFGFETKDENANFSGYLDEKVPYISFSLQESSFGVTSFINIRPISPIESVELDNNKLVY